MGRDSPQAGGCDALPTRPPGPRRAHWRDRPPLRGGVSKNQPPPIVLQRSPWARRSSCPPRRPRRQRLRSRAHNRAGASCRSRAPPSGSIEPASSGKPAESAQPSASVEPSPRWSSLMTSPGRPTARARRASGRRPARRTLVVAGGELETEHPPLPAGRHAGRDEGGHHTTRPASRTLTSWPESLKGEKAVAARARWVPMLRRSPPAESSAHAAPRVSDSA